MTTLMRNYKLVIQFLEERIENLEDYPELQIRECSISVLDFDNDTNDYFEKFWIATWEFESWAKKNNFELK